MNILILMQRDDSYRWSNYENTKSEPDRAIAAFGDIESAAQDPRSQNNNTYFLIVDLENFTKEVTANLIIEGGIDAEAIKSILQQAENDMGGRAGQSKAGSIRRPTQNELEDAFEPDPEFERSV